jgi:hypothetical protein
MKHTSSQKGFVALWIIGAVIVVLGAGGYVFYSKGLSSYANYRFATSTPCLATTTSDAKNATTSPCGGYSGTSGNPLSGLFGYGPDKKESGSGDLGPYHPPMPACDYLSAGEVAGATGLKGVAAVSSGGHDDEMGVGSQCSYTVTDEGHNGTQEMWLSVNAPSKSLSPDTVGGRMTPAEYDKYQYNLILSLAPVTTENGGKVVPLENIGALALETYTIPKSVGKVTEIGVFIYKNRLSVIFKVPVSYDTLTQEQAEQAAISLAKLAASRM